MTRNHDSPLPVAVYDRQGQIWHANDAHHTFAAALGDACGIGEFNALDTDPGQSPETAFEGSPAGRAFKPVRIRCAGEN